jgi:hypothetical protein
LNRKPANWQGRAKIGRRRNQKAGGTEVARKIRFRISGSQGIRVAKNRRTVGENSALNFAAVPCMMPR